MQKQNHHGNYNRKNTNTQSPRPDTIGMSHEHTHSHQHAEVTPRYSLRDFFPLLGTFIVVIFVTISLVYFLNTVTTIDLMRLFEGSFFLVFGFLKVINIKGFAEAYSVYDIITKRARAWGYIYPFVELGLAFAYIFGTALFITNWVTLVVMLVGAAGVFIKLKEKEVVPCACLGAIFKIPMTWVTLFEDLLMAAMASTMLFML
ncbi:MAG: heavy-metal-associated domain-containing protein [Candidatus Uhrbacteria bacterium]|nr:heavy-metal-associated domain-containing protein [Candidatus Uhrbacteria bacterium]